MNKLFPETLKQSARASILSNEKMRAERQHQGALEKTAKIIFHRTAGRIALNVIGKKIGGHKIIGGGADQIVFVNKEGSEVNKLLVCSLGSTGSEAAQQAREHQQLFDLASSYLTGFMVETEYRTADLSALLGRNAVVATQPLVRPLKSFSDVPSEIWTFDTDADYRAHNLALAYRINDLYRATGTFPDLLGHGNVVVTDTLDGNVIRIVDTMVETPALLARPLRCGSSQTREEKYQEILAEWMAYEPTPEPSGFRAGAALQK
jgi:hypothetical protein